MKLDEFLGQHVFTMPIINRPVNMIATIGLVILGLILVFGVLPSLGWY